MFGQRAITPCKVSLPSRHARLLKYMVAISSAVGIIVKIIVIVAVFTFDFDRRARFDSQLAVFLSNCELFLVFSSTEVSILSIQNRHDGNVYTSIAPEFSPIRLLAGSSDLKPPLYGFAEGLAICGTVRGVSRAGPPRHSARRASRASGPMPAGSARSCCGPRQLRFTICTRRSRTQSSH